MRITTLLAVAVVTFSLVACSSGTTGTGTGTSGAAGAGTGTSGNVGTSGNAETNGGANGGGFSATCEGVCSYYVQCKGDATNEVACNSACAQQGYTQQQLGQALQADCPSLVAVVDKGLNPPSSSSSSSGSTGSDCTDCQWDGSSCIWISPSTGLYQACGKGCCPGHD